MPGGDGLPDAAAAERTPSAHSQASDFSEHKSQDGGDTAAERRPQEEAGARKESIFKRLGFGQSNKKDEHTAAGNEGAAQEANEVDDEEAELAGGADSDEEEDGGMPKDYYDEGELEAGTTLHDGPTDKATEQPKRKGIIGMFRLPSFVKKPVAADNELETSVDANGDRPGTPPKKKDGSSPRATAQPVSSTRLAVKRAAERSIFVKMARLLRIVFRQDAAMQTGKEGSVDLKRISEANPYSMRGLQQRVYRMQRLVAILSMVGLFCGIAVNEHCWLGYIPTIEEEMGYCSVPGDYQAAGECTNAGGTWTEGYPNPTTKENGQRCRSTADPQAFLIGIILKSLCSGLTGILLMAIFHLYECIALELCFRNHLEYHREFVDIPFWNMGLLPEFLLEFFVCFPHPGPYLHFNLSVTARGRLTIYNSEVPMSVSVFLYLSPRVIPSKRTHVIQACRIYIPMY